MSSSHRKRGTLLPRFSNWAVIKLLLIIAANLSINHHLFVVESIPPNSTLVNPQPAGQFNIIDRVDQLLLRQKYQNNNRTGQLKIHQLSSSIISNNNNNIKNGRGDGDIFDERMYVPPRRTPAPPPPLFPDIPLNGDAVLRPAAIIIRTTTRRPPIRPVPAAVTAVSIQRNTPERLIYTFVQTPVTPKPTIPTQPPPPPRSGIPSQNKNNNIGGQPLPPQTPTTDPFNMFGPSPNPTQQTPVQPIPRPVTVMPQGGQLPDSRFPPTNSEQSITTTSQPSSKNNENEQEQQQQSTATTTNPFFNLFSPLFVINNLVQEAISNTPAPNAERKDSKGSAVKQAGNVVGETTKEKVAEDVKAAKTAEQKKSGPPKLIEIGAGDTLAPVIGQGDRNDDNNGESTTQKLEEAPTEAPKEKKGPIEIGAGDTVPPAIVNEGERKMSEETTVKEEEPPVTEAPAKKGPIEIGAGDTLPPVLIEEEEEKATNEKPKKKGPIEIGAGDTIAPTMEEEGAQPMEQMTTGKPKEETAEKKGPIEIGAGDTVPPPVNKGDEGTQSSGSGGGNGDVGGGGSDSSKNKLMEIGNGDTIPPAVTEQTEPIMTTTMRSSSGNILSNLFGDSGGPNPLAGGRGGPCDENGVVAALGSNPPAGVQVTVVATVNQVLAFKQSNVSSLVRILMAFCLQILSHIILHQSLRLAAGSECLLPSKKGEVERTESISANINCVSDLMNYPFNYVYCPIAQPGSSGAGKTTKNKFSLKLSPKNTATYNYKVALEKKKWIRIYAGESKFSSSVLMTDGFLTGITLLSLRISFAPYCIRILICMLCIVVTYMTNLLNSGIPVTYYIKLIDIWKMYHFLILFLAFIWNVYYYIQQNKLQDMKDTIWIKDDAESINTSVEIVSNDGDADVDDDKTDNISLPTTTQQDHLASMQSRRRQQRILKFQRKLAGRNRLVAWLLTLIDLAFVIFFFSFSLTYKSSYINLD